MSKNDNRSSFTSWDFLIVLISVVSGKGLSKVLLSSYFNASPHDGGFGWIFTFICIFIVFGILKTIQAHFIKSSDSGKERNDKTKNGIELPENSEKVNLINELMSVPDYLKNNISRINSLPPQILPAWNSNYNNKGVYA